MNDTQPAEPSLHDPDALEPTADVPLDDADADRQPDGSYVGEDNIREGRVGGVMGSTHQQGGQGQGG
jgi:hypothetical protein